MLIVLAAALVILSASSVIARSRATAALGDRTAEGLDLAWMIAESVESPVLAWLERASRLAVLDPDRPPMVVVVDESIQIEGRRVAITATAWDQYGMVPLSAGDPRTGLIALLTESERRIAQRMSGSSEVPGLDLVSEPVAVYPSRDRPDAIGGRLATHNPPRGLSIRRGGSTPAINVNTAPEPLVRAALIAAGVSDPGAVLAKRRAGERVDAGQLRAREDRTLRLVGASTAWGIRTDVEVDGVRVSLWSVYTLHGGTWVLEQRLVIAE